MIFVLVCGCWHSLFWRILRNCARRLKAVSLKQFLELLSCVALDFGCFGCALPRGLERLFYWNDLVLVCFDAIKLL